jgi:hypothetical protein
MANSGRCGRTITVPFLEGTVPPVDNVHPRGCLDLELYVSLATPDRPENWIEAADTWSDRMVNGQTGASGDPGTYQDNPNVRFAIAPLYGEPGFPSVCGERVAPPPPTPGPSEPPPSGGPGPSPPGGGRGGGGGGDDDD